MNSQQVRNLVYNLIRDRGISATVILKGTDSVNFTTGAHTVVTTEVSTKVAIMPQTTSQQFSFNLSQISAGSFMYGGSYGREEMVVIMKASGITLDTHSDIKINNVTYNVKRFVKTICGTAYIVGCTGSRA